MYERETGKITLKKVSFALAALVLVLSATIIIYLTVEESRKAAERSLTVIIFKDEELERLMRRALDKPDGDIVLADIEDIEAVNVMGVCIQVKRTSGPYFGDKSDYHTLFSLNYGANGEIYTQRGDLKTLEDFKQFPNLQTLLIDYQDNPDISALADMKNITQLRLLNDNISEISVIADCRQLKHLDLTNNPVIDYTPLDSLKYTNMNINEWRYDGYKMIHGE